jgi:hypothetical protein
MVQSTMKTNDPRLMFAALLMAAKAADPLLMDYYTEALRERWGITVELPPHVRFHKRPELCKADRP